MLSPVQPYWESLRASGCFFRALAAHSVLLAPLLRERAGIPFPAFSLRSSPQAELAVVLPQHDSRSQVFHCLKRLLLPYSDCSSAPAPHFLALQPRKSETRFCSHYFSHSSRQVLKTIQADMRRSPRRPARELPLPSPQSARLGSWSPSH